MTYREALHRLECAQEQTEECRRNWTAAKLSNSVKSLVWFSLLYAEAANMEAEARELLNEVANEEHLAELRAEGHIGVMEKGQIRWVG